MQASSDPVSLQSDVPLSIALFGCNITNKNSAEVDIAPAFGEITTACNVGQAKNGSLC